MRYFKRHDEPGILTNNWERIGKEYTEKRAANPGYQFSWPQINNEKVNQAILPTLKKQTQEHCSYCDRFPLFRKDDTIDHFKPKSDQRFYKLVCKWDNLYLCCNHCQDAKKVQYHDDLLRPDAEDYTFNRYFIYNYKTNKIVVNPGASDEDKIKAEATLEIFDFNHESLIKARENAVFRFAFDNDFQPDIYEFRFLFD